MPRETFTTRRVHTLKPPKSGRIEIFDTVIPGLCYRVTDKGARSWSIMYRFDGKLRRDTLGTYPALGLAAAREKARATLETQAKGTDPRSLREKAEAKAAKLRADTVETVAEKFITVYASERRWPDLQSVLRREVIPAWGKRPIAGIERKDAMTLLSTIKERAPVRANRALTVIKLFFAWALEHEFTESSPVAGIKNPTRETPRDRVLDDNEIRAFWAASSLLGWPHGPLDRLLLLTAARREEIGGLCWPEVDERRRLIDVAADRVKGGRPRAIPLSKQAEALLADLPRIGGDAELVFTRTGKSPVSDFSKAKDRLDELMLEELRKLAVSAGKDPDKAKLEQWTLHDLRRTARTEMSRIGIQPDIAERVLGHVIGGVRGIYDRYAFLDEKRHALEAWAAHLQSIIDPPAVPKVVRLRGQTGPGGSG